MKSVVWLTVFTILLQLTTSEAFSFSLAAVGLGVAGLAGLKVYSVSKLWGSTHSASASVQHSLTKEPALSPPAQLVVLQNSAGEHVRDNGVSLHRESPVIGIVKGVPAIPTESNVAVESMLLSSRASLRRAASNGIKFNDDLFRWIAKIDDRKCIHRFFCQLGVKPRSFGNIGRMTNMLLMMRAVPEESWAARMYQLGQRQGQSACPAECSELNLHRTLAYLEKHIFETDEPPTVQIVD